MKVHELISLLEDANEDDEVRFASQPAWPFEYSIYDVVRFGRDNKGNVEEDSFYGFENHISDEDDSEESGIVYLVEGDQIGYLPSRVSAELGWR